MNSIVIPNRALYKSKQSTLFVLVTGSLLLGIMIVLGYILKDEPFDTESKFKITLWSIFTFIQALNIYLSFIRPVVLISNESIVFRALNLRLLTKDIVTVDFSGDPIMEIACKNAQKHRIDIRDLQNNDREFLIEYLHKANAEQH